MWSISYQRFWFSVFESKYYSRVLHGLVVTGIFLSHKRSQDPYWSLEMFFRLPRQESATTKRSKIKAIGKTTSCEPACLLTNFEPMFCALAKNFSFPGRRKPRRLGCVFTPVSGSDLSSCIGSSSVPSITLPSGCSISSSSSFTFWSSPSSAAAVTAAAPGFNLLTVHSKNLSIKGKLFSMYWGPLWILPCSGPLPHAFEKSDFWF